MSAPLRRIRIRDVLPMHGATRRVVCEDGERLSIDLADPAHGGTADISRHIAPGGEARVLVDGHGRILGVGHPHARIHPHTLAIAEALGLPRDGAMARAASPLLWRRRPEDAVANPPASGLFASEDGEILLMATCDRFAFHQDGFTIRTALPDTAIAACAGRLMREVVSIPDLDPIGLRILEAHDTPLGTEFVVIPRDGCIEF